MTDARGPRPDAPEPRGLPPAERINLPGRGRTSMRRVQGPAGAPTLMLLHGWTANAALNWFATFGPLSRRFNVVAIDHRGHGRGIRTWRRFRLEECADDAVALADKLGIDQVIPVGYSMGGPIAQLMWRRHHDRVEGLVLCATSRNFRGGRPGERAVLSMMGVASMAARAVPQRVHRSMGERLLNMRYDQSDLGRWAREQVLLNDTRMMVEAGQAIGNFSSRDWIGSVDVPTAVVVTEQDSVVPPYRQHRLAAAIPDATVYRVVGDHGVCAMDPGAFVPALVDACLDVSGRARAGRTRTG